ncbi:ABC transporter ATP-binding protein [Limosilactobacillus reuteri]|uniref:ATP-binding cassette domain-containing protein n=1 Tax=Limosilactobacillus reuteri TaxID=1598 RepID=A0A6A8D135_LIMRT|nr:ABC transporter ATP-binding protein [Limosilactobacillus reuteri]MRG68392.1 ATP-binding cassette domain-containing protein [Limosilactobacillus reuteri]WJK31085.1 ABC transporter ATP-binding protein [Limosilactobacillus reuteri]WLR79923.1 ABC transporter ATP-binding protein [Limosilactobacillus reuteri]
MTENLIEVHHLKKYFHEGHPDEVHAVDDVSFSIRRGEVFGLVGESGSGKSTTGRCILNLYRPTDGQVTYDNQDITQLKTSKDLKKFHHKTAMIFQDPYSSLDPRMSVREIIAEGLQLHGQVKDRQTLDSKVAQTMELVGLTSDLMNRYPYEFSGGQRQRIGIARALATEPEFIVADEPLSALDVSVQAQIVKLMEQLKVTRKLTYLFIAHDISMVKYISDRIGVMYHGRLVELGTANEIVNNPLHPYTKSLLSAVPVPDPNYERVRQQFTYDVQDATSPLREVAQGHYVALSKS